MVQPRGEIQKADPRARRRALILLVGVAAVGASLLATTGIFLPQLGRWILRDFETRFPLVIGGISALLLLPLLWFAVYLWRLGGRTIQAGRFPAPGVPVVRDTEVLRGEPAIQRGWRMRIIAVFLAVAAVWLGVLLWRLY